MNLAYHTPLEWACVISRRLKLLGCGREHRKAAMRRILNEARKVEWQS